MMRPSLMRSTASPNPVLKGNVPEQSTSLVTIMLIAVEARLHDDLARPEMIETITGKGGIAPGFEVHLEASPSRTDSFRDEALSKDHPFSLSLIVFAGVKESFSRWAIWMVVPLDGFASLAGASHIP